MDFAHLFAPHDAQVIGRDPDRGSGSCRNAQVGRVVKGQVGTNLFY